MQNNELKVTGIQMPLPPFTTKVTATLENGSSISLDPSFSPIPNVGSYVVFQTVTSPELEKQLDDIADEQEIEVMVPDISGESNDDGSDYPDMISDSPDQGCLNIYIDGIDGYCEAKVQAETKEHWVAIIKREKISDACKVYQRLIETKNIDKELTDALYSRKEGTLGAKVNLRIEEVVLRNNFHIEMKLKKTSTIEQDQNYPNLDEYPGYLVEDMVQRPKQGDVLLKYSMDGELLTTAYAEDVEEFTEVSIDTKVPYRLISQLRYIEEKEDGLIVVEYTEGPSVIGKIVKYSYAVTQEAMGVHLTVSFKRGGVDKLAPQKLPLPHENISPVYARFYTVEFPEFTNEYGDKIAVPLENWVPSAEFSISTDYLTANKLVALISAKMNFEDGDPAIKETLEVCLKKGQVFSSSNCFKASDKPLTSHEGKIKVSKLSLDCNSKDKYLLTIKISNFW